MSIQFSNESCEWLFFFFIIPILHITCHFQIQIYSSVSSKSDPKISLPYLSLCWVSEMWLTKPSWPRIARYKTYFDKALAKLLFILLSFSRIMQMNDAEKVKGNQMKITFFVWTADYCNTFRVMAANKQRLSANLHIVCLLCKFFRRKFYIVECKCVYYEYCHLDQAKNSKISLVPGLFSNLLDGFSFERATFPYA